MVPSLPTRPPPPVPSQPVVVRPFLEPSQSRPQPLDALQQLSRSLNLASSSDEVSRERAEALAKLESGSSAERTASPPPSRRFFRRARTQSERTPPSFVISRADVDARREKARAFVATLLGESVLERKPKVVPDDIGLLQAGPGGERETYLVFCDGVVLCSYVSHPDPRLSIVAFSVTGREVRWSLLLSFSLVSAVCLTLSTLRRSHPWTQLTTTMAGSATSGPSWPLYPPPCSSPHP
jgi:hypothetical protein